jgi:hypothetical protein
MELASPRLLTLVIGLLCRCASDANGGSFSGGQESPAVNQALRLATHSSITGIPSSFNRKASNHQCFEARGS